MQLLTGQQFDICYITKTRVGFKIPEMTRFLNYIGSYSFALQLFIVNLKILENPQEHMYSEVFFIYKKLLNAKLLMSNFSAEIFIFNFFSINLILLPVKAL